MKDDLSKTLPALTVSDEPVASLKVQVFVIGIFEKEDKLPDKVKILDDALGGPIARVIFSGDFTGKYEEVSLLYTQSSTGPQRLCLVGLGKREKFSEARLAAAAATAARYVKKLGVTTVAFPHDLATEADIPPDYAAQTVFCGAALGLYSFSSLKKNDEKKKGIENIVIAAEGSAAGDGAQKGRIIADSVYLARDLANTPANLMTPSILGKRAKEVAKKSGFIVTILDKKEIQRLKMGAFLGVARGSAQPPCLIVAQYLPKGNKRPPVALVGKGITFDSGGISLKPAENMDKMKTDMSGAAATLGVVAAVARLGLPIGVIGVMPATENMPGPDALKPGDVLVSMDKTTIEIISTDAEGRLILADAITYAKQFSPSLIIDIATLTGSAVIALGRRVTALFSSQESLAEKIREASRKSGEQVWPMPLFDHYVDQIRGDVADIKNSTGREGGSITAATFLKRFSGDEIPWAHLDIAGTARSDKDYGWVTKGATGWGVMILVEFMRNLSRR